jgi:hypothetical protein
MLKTESVKSQRASCADRMTDQTQLMATSSKERTIILLMKFNSTL